MHTNCLIWEGCTTRGYPQFAKPEFGTRYGHRITWARANKQDPGKLMVLHRCNNKRCINPEHLYLGTHADNTADALRDGLFVSRKLTEDDVRAIRKLRPTTTLAKLAVQFNTCKSNLRRILGGETWRTVV